MIATRISVCNEALNLIGAKSILSFDDQSENARRCAVLYDSTRRTLLRMHPWSCAKKRVQLSPVVTHPSFGYAHAFALPSDFERLVSAGTKEFEIENRHILANTNLINLIYVYDNDNEQTWDSLFRQCMIDYLASKLAKAITGSNAEGDSAWQRVQMMLKQARAINGQERPSQNFSDDFQSELIGVRY
ncbi:hypothetical protein [Acinetobacter larvae]|uniref:Uncharacterized protein n=1 Tax=Acinetobacter larvae TaxID=1789224 RepID=A0A1B2LXB0_9GAMM|nr:hypothetical protein [Acinetobacter larvae]AOA57570.1 hypothetical protein BFG52_03850 [Acinetobacter larvae]